MKYSLTIGFFVSEENHRPENRTVIISADDIETLKNSSNQYIDHFNRQYEELKKSIEGGEHD